MFHVIENFLNDTELNTILAEVEQLEFSDGKRTAAAIAKTAKQNLQADEFAKSGAHRLVTQKLARHREFQNAAMPARITTLLLSRYQSGMAYRRHVDNPVMEAGRIRTDLAFTLFLSGPDSYEGGALEINLGGGAPNAMRYKLSAGSMIVYPAHHLHNVEEVKSGERFAIVGWVQSMIRDGAQREIVRELRMAGVRLHQLDNDSAAFAGLNRALGSLTRMWLDKG
jgi:PKHD-type hydroxylase